MFMLATASVPSNITIQWKLLDTNERLIEVDLIHCKDYILESVETNKFQTACQKSV